MIFRALSGGLVTAERPALAIRRYEHRLEGRRHSKSEHKCAPHILLFILRSLYCSKAFITVRKSLLRRCFLQRATHVPALTSTLLETPNGCCARQLSTSSRLCEDDPLYYCPMLVYEGNTDFFSFPRSTNDLTPLNTSDDTFSFVAVTASQQSERATVTLRVSNLNDPPTLRLPDNATYYPRIPNRVASGVSSACQIMWNDLITTQSRSLGVMFSIPSPASYPAAFTVGCTS
eukprot:6197143-Pleurochrysis_carterae.AAC.2